LRDMPLALSRWPPHCVAFRHFARAKGQCAQSISPDSMVSRSPASLEPAAPPIPTAASKDDDHDNDDQNCRRVHVALLLSRASVARDDISQRSRYASPTSSTPHSPSIDQPRLPGLALGEGARGVPQRHRGHRGLCIADRGTCHKRRRPAEARRRPSRAMAITLGSGLK
jgi:hypothetical protein